MGSAAKDCSHGHLLVVDQKEEDNDLPLEEDWTKEGGVGGSFVHVEELHLFPPITTYHATPQASRAIPNGRSWRQLLVYVNKACRVAKANKPYKATQQGIVQRLWHYAAVYLALFSFLGVQARSTERHPSSDASDTYGLVSLGLLYHDVNMPF